MFCQVLILCLAVTAVLSAPTDVVPLEKQQPTVIPIISQSEELEPNGTYKFSYETGNGIKREEIQYDKIVPKLRGQSDASNEGGENYGSDEIHVQQGSYSYTAPDGTIITLRYIADENGFQAFGDHLPRAPEPLSVSSNLSNKSSRALKTADSAEAAAVPASAAKPVPAPELPKPTAEAEQSVPKALTETSEAAPALPESSAADTSNEIEPKSGVNLAAPEQNTLVKNAAEISTTVASELLTEVTSTAAVADQSSTVESEQSDAATEQSLTTASEESSTAAADQSTPAVVVEEPASTASAEVPVTNTPVEQVASTQSDDVVTSNTGDNQTPSSATTEQSAVSESEQSATTEAALLSEEPAPSTVTV